MTFLRNKAKKTVLIFLLLVFSILSIRKLSYVFQFFQFSLSLPAQRGHKFDLLARSFLRNERLSVLVKDKFLDNVDFLASFLAELIIENQVFQLENKYDALLPHVLRKFPENIFLGHLGFYEKKDLPRDWENLDALALKLLRESRFNNFTFPGLTQRIIDKELPDLSLHELISYLNWMENFSLAEDLLRWSYEEKKIGEDIYKALYEDWNQRKRRHIDDKEVHQQTAHISTIVSLGDSGLKILPGRNLLADGSFEKKNSFVQFWTVSDMSDREPFSKGSFYVDIDFLEGSSMKVMGFFVKRLEGKSPARGGFWYKGRIFLEEKTYLFSFKYKTLHGSEVSSFWLANGLKEPRTGPSPSKWKRVYYIFNNTHYKLESVKPLLRIWGAGSVWFDDIGLYDIELEGTAVEKDALFIH